MRYIFIFQFLQKKLKDRHHKDTKIIHTSKYIIILTKNNNS